MLLGTSARRRKGATVVESGIVLLLTLLLVMGGIVGGLGIFRYQQIASLAREAARYASVRGGQYHKDTGKPAATQQSVHDEIIALEAVALDMTKLTYSVTWDEPNSKMPVYYDSTNKVWKGNTVTVTISYQWVPEAFFGGATMTSTSVMPISN
jgi:Flp pilus assembly protein TadG